MYRIEPTTKLTPAYILFKDSEEIAISDSSEELAEFAYKLIGRENTAKLVNDKLEDLQKLNAKISCYI